MRNTLTEEELLRMIQQNYCMQKLNNTSHDIDHIVRYMEVMKPEPPDFIYCDDTYLEHFEVTAYKRVERSDGKLHSIHLADEAKLEKRINITQNIFRAANYHTPDNRTNTRYLKDNIYDIISEKTKKQAEYDRKCSTAQKRHLMIELKSRCEIILGNDGQYLDHEVEYNDKENPKEFYEVYRDLNFMKALKDEYSSKWDLLLFIDEFIDLDIHIFNLYCFDLKEDIVHRNMKNYPDRLFQIIQSGKQVLHMSGAVNVTNIRYEIVADDDDITSSLLNSYSADTMTVSNIQLFKSCHDSIYMTKDNGLQFETSQRAFAINPDVDYDVMIKYIPLLLKDSLFLDCQGTFIKLKRRTFTDAFFFHDGTDAYYRIDDKTSLPLKIITR
jgi:hypothetical protein